MQNQMAEDFTFKGFSLEKWTWGTIIQFDSKNKYPGRNPRTTVHNLPLINSFLLQYFS